MVGSAGLKEDIFPSSSTAVTSAVRSSGGVTGGEHTQSAGKYNTDTKHKHKKIEKRKKHDNCEKHKNRWCTDTQYKTHPSENTGEENMKTNSLEKSVKNTGRKLMSLFFVFLFTFFPSICIFVFVYFCLILL